MKFECCPLIKSYVPLQMYKLRHGYISLLKNIPIILLLYVLLLDIHFVVNNIVI